MKKMLKELKRKWQVVAAVLFGVFVLGVVPQNALAWSPINFDQGNLDPSKVKEVGGKLIKLERMLAIILLIAIVIAVGVSIALNNDDRNAHTESKKKIVSVAIGIAIVSLAVIIVIGLYKMLNPNSPWDSMLHIAINAIVKIA